MSKKKYFKIKESQLSSIEALIQGCVKAQHSGGVFTLKEASIINAAVSDLNTISSIAYDEEELSEDVEEQTEKVDESFSEEIDE